MKKIRILLYKTPWKPKLKYLVNWLISLRTWSKWSHIEIWTPDERLLFIGQDHLMKTKNFYGDCYTSTMRGEANGTVKRPASEVLKHPGNWDYSEI